MEKIDFDKPVQTYSGKYVTIFTTTGPDKEWPVVGSVEGSKVTFQWNLEGVVKNKKEQYNLEQAPDYTEYSTSITEGEHNRGKEVVYVQILPTEKKVVFRLKEGWTGEVLGELNKTISTPKTHTKTPSESHSKQEDDPPGGLAGVFFKQVQEEMRRA
jgi:hypothetical protein